MMQQTLESRVRPLRESAREVVRRLGLLSAQSWLGISVSQNHTMIELEREGVLTASELADRLNLDKSTMSRVISGLIKLGYVEEIEGNEDKRVKPIGLSREGRTLMKRTQSLLDEQVRQALSCVEEDEQEAILRGMTLYAKALRRDHLQKQFTIRPIRSADNPVVARLVRETLTEFGASGPGFALHDSEVDAMFESYRPPKAGYWVVERDRKVQGGAGFAQLIGGPKGVCELRKMYFFPEMRGAGMGRKLMETVLAGAKAASFKKCYLETLDHMYQARSLYSRFGFEQLSKPMGGTGHFGCNSWYLKDL